MDQVRVTTEDVLGAPRAPGQASTGVVVRERENTRDAGAPLNARGEASGSNAQREVEYQVGRRVEQVATQPGAIRRLHVAAVVSRSLEPKQLDQLREIVSAAAGIVPERGDTVVVQSLQDLGVAKPAAAADGRETQATTVAAPSAARASRTPIAHNATRAWWTWPAGGAAAVLLAGAVALLLLVRRRTGQGEPARISASEREKLLAVVRVWLEDGAPRPLPSSSLAAEKRS
jgi:flagellar M-ring protein FliF